jgi:choline kinase
MTKAIILSAGQGQRLLPLTLDRPKGMVDVAGTTIIERQIRLFAKVGIQEIAIVKGYCAESIPDRGLRHYTNSEYASSNMVYSLFCAAPELEGGEVVVSYGDILYSEAVLRALLASTAAVSVVVDLDWKAYFAQRFADPFDDAESLVFGEGHAIRSIGRRSPSPEEVQAQYIGLIKFREEGLERLHELREAVAASDRTIGWGRPWRKAFMTDLLQELVFRGQEVRGVPITGGWCEIDSLRDYELAQRLAADLT